MDSKICLIRHGITEGNKNKLFYGHSDIPLAKEGIINLKELVNGGIYPDGSKAEFYTTGLMRTEQTLELIYGKQQHETLHQLKEINFGDFEMKSYEELKDLAEYQTWMADKKGILAPPNGESLSSFSRRVEKGFEDLKQRHLQNVVSMRHKAEEALSITVCHGGTICAILQSIYPELNENFYKWIPDPGHGYMLFMKDAKVADIDKF